MAERARATVPLTLKQVFRLGEKRMAEARQAVAHARRLAHITQQVLSESRRLHEGRNLIGYGFTRF